ncbi:DUF1707 domain-containing protein [Microbispora sp. H11081]|uniref:DUF1707 SHOCT-like domain-containing protein n=1 Tax=Microbispora sp. H11081 TaxID=2729107 RepID=UPI00147385F6|nr:DUF1707 domain-containing protein [Microbispora sp. H11081]
MALAPEMRASDGDRERVAAALREHMAEGRLTLDEFNERLERVYQSRTYGELDTLTSDLPGIDLHRLQSAVEPAPQARRARPARPDGRARTGLQAAWSTWAGAVGVTWTVWLVAGLSSGHFANPWPLWVMGPWGVILLISTITGMAGGSRGRDT